MKTKFCQAYSDLRAGKLKKDINSDFSMPQIFVRVLKNYSGERLLAKKIAEKAVLHFPHKMALKASKSTDKEIFNAKTKEEVEKIIIKKLAREITPKCRVSMKKIDPNVHILKVKGEPIEYCYIYKKQNVKKSKVVVSTKNKNIKNNHKTLPKEKNIPVLDKILDDKHIVVIKNYVVNN